MSSVYALGDPRTNEIYYVGIAQDVYRRYAQHISHPHKNEQKNTWLEDLREAGMVPTLLILETDPDSIYDRERYWIQHYLNLGMPLTNIVGVQLPATEEVTRVDEVVDELTKMSTSVHMRVRLKVKELAEQKGISIHRLHLRTEIALSSIRKFYQDPYADIKISTLLRIAEVLDCSICDLFEEEKP